MTPRIRRDFYEHLSTTRAGPRVKALLTAAAVRLLTEEARFTRRKAKFAKKEERRQARISWWHELEKELPERQEPLNLSGLVAYPHEEQIEALRA
jgi:hypothetical protein